MFVGHLAVALGAKRAVPAVPLGTLVAAAFALDLIWPVLLLAGVERVRVDPGNTAFTPLAFDSYPWTHSLVMTLVWGGVSGGAAFVLLKSARAGVTVGLAVISHWGLDFVAHRPDLPLWPEGPVVGLGLWNSVGATLLVEGALFLAAIALYHGATRPRDRAGEWAFWTLVLLTSAIWVSGPFAPPPPSAGAVAVAALALWAFPPWGGWIERHRLPREPRQRGVQRK